ncbi:MULTISPECIES: hypothetical protein [Mucilaginibacter]|nr:MULTISPECIES: hypothetical protein [Mucilaginibacter]
MEKQQLHNYLNLAPGSAGNDIPAGIFKNDKVILINILDWFV